MSKPQSTRPDAGPPSGKARRAAWLVVPVVAAGLAGVFLWPHAPTPLGRAEVRLELPPPAPADPRGGTAPPEDLSPDAQVALIQSDVMARRTVDELRRDAGRGSLRTFPLTETQVVDALSAAHPPGTRAVVITAVADTPALASRLADAAARAFVRWKQENAQGSAYYRVSQLRSDVGHARHRAQRLAALASAAPSAHGTDAAGADLRQSAQQAAAEYQRLQAVLVAAQRQSDHVSSGVVIVDDRPRAAGAGGERPQAFPPP